MVIVTLMFMSTFYVVNNLKLNCRLYEDDIDTCVVDYNNAVERKKRNKCKMHLVIMETVLD